MIRIGTWRAWTLASLALAASVAAQADDMKTPLSLIPVPAVLETKPGTFHLRDGAALVVESKNAKAASIARAFSKRLAEARGLQLDVRPFGGGATRDAIVLRLDPDLANVPSGEGYAIDVDAHAIRVEARDPRGLFYGGVTLGQLLTQATTKTRRIAVPELHIVDQPRLRWRGAMLDSARHFQSPDFIRRFIDQLAQLKLNTFHWHLTDDQGWRIAIPGYPKLTEVGAWRRPAGAAGTDANGRPVRYGGWYTDAEIRDIVRYASARNVTIVPEIDMPGHMQAAIAAYPEFGSTDRAPAVSSAWGVHAYLLNVDEATLAFVDRVLDHVTDLFPGPYVHIGGDEAIKDQWKASPKVQARMHALGIRDENALQGWFVAHVAKHLAARGRRAVGWDEILEGGVPADAIVMSWRGADGGVAAAKAGHDVVMAPSPTLYLDHLQADAPDAPPGRPELETLADLYAYDPLPAAIDAKAAAHVLGAQANLWTEHMRTADRVEHAAFPRLDALAEALWSPKRKRDWHDFLARLVPEIDRQRAAGVDVADSAFEVVPSLDYERERGRVRVTLSDQVDLPIRYTLDGSAPGARSTRYDAPLDLDVPSTLRAAAFLGDRRLGEALATTLDATTLLTRPSAELRQCAGHLTLRLEDDAPADGDRAVFSVDLFDPCWIWPKATLDGIAGIEATVGRIPFNFELAHDASHVVPRAQPATPGGELRIMKDDCASAPIATLPLAEARRNDGLTRLSAALGDIGGRHDLCFVFAVRDPGWSWTIDRVRLLPRDD